MKEKKEREREKKNKAQRRETRGTREELGDNFPSKEGGLKGER